MVSARETRLWTYAKAGVAPTQVAEETGWPLELIIKETRRLASEFDNVFDDRMQLQINKQVLREHIGRLEAEAKDGNKDSWKALIDAVSRQNQQIDKSMDRAEADLERVNQVYVRKMIQIVEGTVYKHYQEIAKQTGLPFEELISDFKEILQVEAAEHDDSVQ